MENLPLKLYPNKLKTVLLFLISIGFVVLSIYNFINAEGWLEKAIFSCTGFLFLVCAAVFVINFLPSANFLEVTDKGIETKNLFKSTFIPWENLENFGSRRVFLNKLVLYNFSDQFKNQSLDKKMSKKFFGYNGALPDTYGMSAEKLAELLNSYREKYS